MATPLIPMRPKGAKFDLKPQEMDCLNWFVLSGCARDEAFLRFIHPDYLVNRNTVAVKEAVKQFFSMADVRGYIEAYRQTINGQAEEQQPEKPALDTTGKTLDEKKSLALSKLVEYVLNEANNISSAEDPKAILDYANKIGLFDADDEVVEQPRRYLPENCGQCRYRLFCEENATDECQFCKYRQFGEDNGVHYEPENQLQIAYEE